VVGNSYHLVPGLGKIRPRSIALGYNRDTSCLSRSIDRLRSPGMAAHRRGWVGQRSDVRLCPGDPTYRTTPRCPMLRDGDDDDITKLKFSCLLSSSSFFLSFFPLLYFLSCSSIRSLALIDFSELSIRFCRLFIFLDLVHTFGLPLIKTILHFISSPSLPPSLPPSLSLSLSLQ